MKAVMLIDFGSTYTKVTGVDLESKRILATSKAFTTVDSNICVGLEKAITELESKCNVTDWEYKYGCSSAAGGLRMVAVGLVNDLTTKAAKEAALSAGAKVLKVYSMELTNEDIEDINQLNPDILLLTGGTDGGNQKVLLHNGKQLAKTIGDFPIIFSGNRSVKNEVITILKEANKEVIATENVMPTFGVLNIVPAREAIQEVFLNKIIEAKGIKNAESLIDNVLMPTPLAVMRGAKLLADGYNLESGFGDLIVVDIGGATTDIHSVTDGLPSLPNVVLKGIEEPRVKRSVEGDLGARYSLSSVMEVSDQEELAQKLQITENKLKIVIKCVIDHPDMTPDNVESYELEEEEKMLLTKVLESFDTYVAAKATEESIKRHAGILKEHYTPFGISYEQFGKDLTKVSKIIGTGGPLIHAKEPRTILEKGNYHESYPFVLKPKLNDYYLDDQYILAAMGLLSDINQEVAYTILVNNIKKL